MGKKAKPKVSHHKQDINYNQEDEKIPHEKDASSTSEDSSSVNSAE
jgi:hypothetical protein